MLDITATFANGLLSINGDTADNYIQIASDVSGLVTWKLASGGIANPINISGIGTIAAASVTGIYIDGSTNNDEIHVEAVAPSNFPNIGALGGQGITLTTGPTANNSDTIRGSQFPDSIIGGAGNDLIFGNDGDDTVRGNAGNDTINAGGGADRIEGGAGNDDLRGDLGPTTFVFSGASLGSDILRSTEPAANLANASTLDFSGATFAISNLELPELNEILTNGQGGQQFQEVNAGNLSLNFRQHPLIPVQSAYLHVTGTSQSDLIRGSSMVNLLAGGAGNDTLIGEGGTDTLFGDTGHDSLDGGAGADQLLGAHDNDVLLGGDDGDELWGGSGNDSLDGGAGPDSANGEVGTDWLSGGAGADTLSGGSDSDTLSGDSDNDTLYGGAGGDDLRGGTEQDLFPDLDSNDTAVGGSGSDTFTLNGQLTAISYVAIDGGADSGDTLTITDTATTSGVVSIDGEAFYRGSYNPFAKVSNVATVTWTMPTAITNATILATLPGIAYNLGGFAGTDTIDIGDANAVTRRGLDAVLGQVQITAASGTVDVALRDEQSPSGHSYSVSTIGSSAVVGRTGSGSVIVNGAGIRAVTLNASHFSDVVEIEKTLANVTTTIDVNGGDDLVTIGTTSSLATIAGALNVQLDAGDDAATFLYGVRSSGSPAISVSGQEGSDTYRVDAPTNSIALSGVTVSDSGFLHPDYIDTLDISGNNLTSAGSFASISGIEQFNASHNLLSSASFPTGWSSSALASVDLRYNKLNLTSGSALSALTSVTTLQSVLLHGNEFPLNQYDGNGAAVVPDLAAFGALAGKLLRVDLPAIGLPIAERVATEDAALSAIAKALHFLPLEIYEYVLNNFEYEVYAGRMKSPLAVLQTRAGNSWDLTNFLRELLRKAGMSDSALNFARTDATEDAYAIASAADVRDWLGTTYQSNLPANLDPATNILQV